eukprot:5342889-Amphidinium_carterae.2
MHATSSASASMRLDLDSRRLKQKLHDFFTDVRLVALVLHFLGDLSSAQRAGADMLVDQAMQKE